MLEKKDRFETFVLSIDSIHKCICKIKQDIIANSSLKGVHTLWLYELLQCPEGLTAAELAVKSKIDRSLVSREVSALVDDGFITLEEGRGKRAYNTRLILTEKGREVAFEISEAALALQQGVSSEIEPSELEVFYNVLEKIRSNLAIASKD